MPPFEVSWKRNLNEQAFLFRYLKNLYEEFKKFIFYFVLLSTDYFNYKNPI